MKKLQKSSIIFAILITLMGCYTPPPNGRMIEDMSFNPPKAHGDFVLIDVLAELSLDDAIRIGLANNPDYRSTMYSIESARMAYYQTLGSYSPIVTANVGLGQQFYNHDQQGNRFLGQNDNYFYLSTGVQATMMVFDGLVREFLVLANKRGIKLEENLSLNAKRILIKSISFAYLEIINSESNLVIAESNAEFQKQQLDVATLKNRAGEVSRSDVLTFQAQYQQAVMTIIEAKNRIVLARNAISLLLGYPVGALPDGLKLSMPNNTFAFLMPLDFYISEALKLRPDLNAYRDELNIYKYGYYSSYSAYLPKVFAFANYNYSNGSNLNYGSTGASNLSLGGNSFNYGMFATLTLFDGFQRYNKIRSTKNALDSKYIEGSQKCLNVIREVNDAYINILSNAQLLENSEVLRNTLFEARNLIAREYEVGEVDILRIDSAQNQFINSEYRLLNTRINSLKSYIALKFACSLF